MSSWGCPHELEGKCQKINGFACDPGMKGCVLAGRYVFANSEQKNARLREKQSRHQPDGATEREAAEVSRSRAKDQND